MWANHGDDIRIPYSGTPALKGDFVRQQLSCSAKRRLNEGCISAKHIFEECNNINIYVVGFKTLTVPKLTNII